MGHAWEILGHVWDMVLGGFWDIAFWDIEVGYTGTPLGHVWDTSLSTGGICAYASLAHSAARIDMYMHMCCHLHSYMFVDV